MLTQFPLFLILLLTATPARPWGPPAFVVLPDTVEISEWRVPWPDSRPRDPFVDAEQRVWFVGQRTDYIAAFDQFTQEFRQFPLAEGAGPHNLVVGPNGAVWYAGNRHANIGRLDPETGHIATFPMPEPAAGDPHTLIFDAAGNLWFTVQHGNFIGRLDPATEAVRLVAVPTAGARPYGIVIDSQNRPWIATFGTNKIATVDPATMTLTEFPLPDPRARPRRLAITSDDKVWYVDYARGFLARLDPQTGQIAEWAAPSGAASLPYAMTVDDRDRLWFVETGPRPNRLVGFDPAREAFFSVTSIPSGGGSVRHMVFDRSSRAIWFGTDANTLGRATVP